MEITNAIFDSLNRLKSRLWEKDPALKYANGDLPFRAELFNADQMEQYGKVLAGLHVVGPKPTPDQQLLSRLAENESVLMDVHSLIMESVRASMSITPAGEWLLDNFYLIEEHIRTSKKHLPKRYSEELPRLANGTSAGLPRVYDIAKENISHGDGRVDAESLSRFVKAYQTVTVLKIGELWAIPIMLRFALIENLRRVASRVAIGRIDRNLANYWADQMTHAVENDPKSLILIIADMARSDPPMSAPFVSEFARRLQGQNPSLAFPLTWIEQRLSESNQSLAQMIQQGNQQLAADQVSISNSIASLRLLGAMNWRDFVENLSVVEKTLQDDPAHVYSRMDFTTRDQYRHVIEKIAKYSDLSEIQIAQEAISMAQSSMDQFGISDRKAHVGYYLVSKGLPQLEATAKMHLPFLEKLEQLCFRFPLLFYTGSISLLIFVFSWCLIMPLHHRGVHSFLLWICGLVIVLSVSQLSLALINWLTTLLISPKPLPRLDFMKGVDPESRTLVVIPTLLINIEDSEKLVEELEVRFLANQDDNIFFGLLTDFRDADQEHLPDDDKLVSFVKEKIEELNKKHTSTRGAMFYLFHRPRLWNPIELKWMGYERKRGKLADLNALLRGSEPGKFSLIVGDTNILQKVKYVITLDTDTELPRDSARQFIGSMAHPLNKPLYDTKKRRVIDGYTILQPRVGVSLPGTNRSIYAKLFGTEPGIDPYTKAISDVYQDLFGEGSFIGKGIYDVDSFELVLKDRFPENRILSHDLLEGSYVRSGLISDALLFEDYPMTYFADVNRRHRWIRGDWQILPWLMPYVPSFRGPSQRNPLSILSWLKILDNIRRSLVPLSLTALLLIGWLFLAAWFWTLVVICILLIPSILISAIDFFNRPEEVHIKQHLTESRQLLLRHLIQASFMIITLPYEAFYNLDALIRTCWRLMISKKRLLEWNPSGITGNFMPERLVGVFKSMWILPALATITLLSLIILNPLSLTVAWPFLVSWFLSPVVVWLVSLPIKPRVARFSASQSRFLFSISRKTWLFFDHFVTANDNWLPPDNYQEHPNPVTAHRTSPTNIGLSLLANLTAYDFGYIMTGELLERTANTFNTMKKMDRYQGHFYNWYDTQTLKPLQPLYISSVDSGNLAGHLLTLKPGLSALSDQSIFGPRTLEGINDTLHILSDLTGKYTPPSIVNFRKKLNTYLGLPPKTLSETWEVCRTLKDLSAAIVDGFTKSIDTEVLQWATLLNTQCDKVYSEINYLIPWISLLVQTNEIKEELQLEELPTLRKIASLEKAVQLYIQKRSLSSETVFSETSFTDLLAMIRESSKRAMERIDFIDHLINEVDDFSVMEYDFLYDHSRHLLSIGYNIDDRRRDAGYYDLLASEARLTTFIAIAQGQIPQESWFALGRLLTITEGEPTLLSWSGSMFEYLMPLIVMPSYENTLLYQTCKGAVLRQIEYGKQRGVPWGISECGYQNFDINLNYQYRAFGVPGLGLKRGLSEDLVIAPYATVMALMVKPEEACHNLEKLSNEGFEGKYGFYEAVDYTPSRVPSGQSNVIIRSFMSHHMGMSFLSLSFVLLNEPMQRRFASDTLLQATLLLLHERIPRITAFHTLTSSETNVRANVGKVEMPFRIFNTPNTPFPEIHLLSNGKYQTMISSAGGGFSKWRDMAVTRWREDSTCDNWGTFCYIRDADTGNYWSASYQPTLKKPEKYEAIFSEGRAEFKRRDYDIDAHTEIVVSPEDDIELRRIHLTNRTSNTRIIDITSYAEVVLALPAAEATHPAFNSLFIQTEIVFQRQAILCTRRPRAADEKPPWMFHLMAAHGVEIRNVTYETDRMKFIGHGNTTVAPLAMTAAKSLSNSHGPVLDPVVAIQYQIVLEPEGTATIDIVTGAAETRENAMEGIEKYQDQQLANRVFDLAWTHSQVVLQQINAVESDAQLYGRLASFIMYNNPLLRADASVIIKNHRGQSSLWGYSISGDIPIVLLQIEDPNNINLVRQLVQAHAYWRLKGLATDLVIWNESHPGYRQNIQEQIMGLIAAGMEANVVGKPGGIFVRSGDQLSAEDRILIQTVARVVISDKRGTFADQINRRKFNEPLGVRWKPARTIRREIYPEPEIPNRDLAFFNGIGGFTPDGKEYVILTSKESITPMPWVNVLANADFGTVVSENGMAYTWSENAHEYRLTPWNNDFVRDSGGETMYIRDEESGYYWSPLPFLKEDGVYTTRHGFGYSVFEYSANGIASELWVFVSVDSSVKFSVLKLRNVSGKSRKLSVTGYVELVLGDLRPKTAMHVVTEANMTGNTIFARNSYHAEFGERVAFFQANDEVPGTCTCDRTEFIGRNGTLANPSALAYTKLSGKVGAALDPCIVIQIPVELMDRQEREIVFTFGAGKNMDEANNLAQRFRGSDAAQKELEKVWEYWKQTLGSVQVQTPDTALNFMANGWLLYQTLACRIWARSGYYQSGGAYGFRDQLQDSMALVYARPQLFRDQLLLHASRQFVEGDVQHWWHPPIDRGVRTHCSDDYLWLPVATSRYVLSTGDTGILDESIFFLEGRLVNPDEESYYDLPSQSNDKESLYQHCVRAITHGFNYGSHGFPLIGSCDWNDGMNKVGEKGKGESVWLAFFMYDVLTEFAKVAQLYKDMSFAEQCHREALTLRKNIELNGWDGEWYRRAYFDDGTPLGSHENTECQIDSLSQSWSVLSAAGDSEHSTKAMESVNNKLVRRDKKLVQLLDPPFDKSDLNPGYIKGYIPGVRENGGQYTHAAVWVAMAFAKLKDSKNAWEIVSMLNPINHSKTPDDVMRYKVEPYVLAADVYAFEPHVGRGGWTWYTGSAGWMYRLIIESLLGLRLEGNNLYIEPCFPEEWSSYTINYKYRQTLYVITIVKLQENGVKPEITVDGVPNTDSAIHLENDEREHKVEVAIS